MQQNLQSGAPSHSIIGVNVVSSSYQEVVNRSLLWARQQASRALFFANVHMIMEAFDDRGFRDLLNGGDLISPDGVPLVWALKLLGRRNSSRVYGPDATVALLEAAEREDMPVGFYGSSPDVLEALLEAVRTKYPALRIPFVESPPFRRLSAEEDDAVVRRIQASGARLLFVGLGCPKQERWIMEHRGKLPVVMLGVGAAFDFLANTKRQAPRWIMRLGLEWAFRLAVEPRRLASRYFRHNPRFVALLTRQVLRKRLALLRG